MSNWENYLEQEDRPHKHVQKPNKNIYCRKNKLENKQYGPHIYKEDDNSCILCGHLKHKNNEESFKKIKENTNE